MPGASAVNNLVASRDGLVYGMAGETLFVFDAARRQVVERKKMPFRAAIYNAVAAGPDGRIWGLTREGVFVIDPETRQVTFGGRSAPAGHRRLCAPRKRRLISSPAQPSGGTICPPPRHHLDRFAEQGFAEIQEPAALPAAEGGRAYPRKPRPRISRSVSAYASRTHSTMRSGSGEYSNSMLMAPS